MTSPPELDAATTALDRFGHSRENTYAALSEITGAPESTIWHRDHGRPSRREKAIAQQYLTPQEEKALVNYFLRSDKNGYPLPIKFACTLAYVIALRRATLWVARIANADATAIRPPGPNWPQAFQRRWPELKSLFGSRMRRKLRYIKKART